MFLFLSQEHPLEASVLTYKVPWKEGPGTKSWTQLSMQAQAGLMHPHAERVGHPTSLGTEVHAFRSLQDLAPTSSDYSSNFFKIN